MRETHENECVICFQVIPVEEYNLMECPEYYETDAGLICGKCYFEVYLRPWIDLVKFCLIG